MFALFLLAAFEVKEALPPLLHATSLPGDGPSELIGDAVTEMLSRVLAALSHDHLEAIDTLIGNRSLDQSVQCAAADAYLFSREAWPISACCGGLLYSY